MRSAARTKLLTIDLVREGVRVGEAMVQRGHGGLLFILGCRVYANETDVDLYTARSGLCCEIPPPPTRPIPGAGVVWCEVRIRFIF